MGGQSRGEVPGPDGQPLPIAGWRTGCRLDGVTGRKRLPEPVDVDPAALVPDELERRGIRRLPTTLRESTDALAADPVMREALGPALVDSVLAVRESEIGLFAEASAEGVLRALRWTH